jgi:hypothetical protein
MREQDEWGVGYCSRGRERVERSVELELDC